MTRRPYFSQDGVTIYHGACVDVLAEMEARSVGIIVTDPPYTESTHKGARTNKGRVGRTGVKGSCAHQIDFASIDVDSLMLAFDAMGRVARRWLIATAAYQHVAEIEANPPRGLRWARCGVWTKIAPTPQLTSDRPGVGWEAIAMLHAADGERMRWNGGGRAAVYHCQAEMRGVYPTQKPEALIQRLLADFADPGDDVLDPFMGSGTTLLCAWKRGHKATGCDVREEACEIAAKRIEAAMRQGRLPTDAARAKVVQGTMAF